MNAPVRELSAIRKEFGAVIVAVGPHQLKTLLPGLAPDYRVPADLHLLPAVPRAGGARRPHARVFRGACVQWAFDRASLTGERGPVACVISAQGDHQQMAQEELAAACHRELAAALPGLPDPLNGPASSPRKRATVACVPGIKDFDLRESEKDYFPRRRLS